MRRFAGMVALLLLFAGTAPLLACMTGDTMSHEESVCCRALHDHCGEMARLDCCRTERQTEGHPQIATAIPTFDLYWVVVSWLPAATIVPQMVASSSFAAPPEHSPPGLLSASTTVLRI